MDIKEWLPEFKVSAESDPELMNYFLKTRYISEILEGGKWLVLGRKGTGKSAIFEYFVSAPPDSIKDFITIPLSFKEYPWPIHKLYKESLEGELSAYQKSWQYLLIVNLISKLIDVKVRNNIPLSRREQTAKKILSTIYGSPIPSLAEIIKSKIFRLESLSLPTLEAGEVSLSVGEISFESIREDAQLQNKLRSNAYRILDYFDGIISESLGSYKILIILDQLDESWLEGEIDEYKKVLINLINACKNMNSLAKYQSQIKIVIFLRTDIFETLRFNDKNKVFQDNSTEISWDENTLNDMYFERIKKYKPTEVQLNMAHKSNSIFEVKNVRHGATPLKFIIRRSFLRPRDIIVNFNKIRSIHSETKSNLFTSNDLYSSEKDYSLSMYNEILDEWSTQRPDIEKLLSVLQNIGYQAFKMENFIDKYNSIFGISEKSTIENELLFLFNNSIVGQKIHANWEYKCSNLHLIIDYKKEFHVNNALKSRLILTEGRP